VTHAYTPQQVADLVREGMFANDHASKSLGMHILEVGPGTATITMTVRRDMLNGFQICHGGFITTLADSTFAFACNSYNELTVAAGITVDFIAPAHEGDVLTAVGKEISLTGRTGIYDVEVKNQHGKRVAMFRGRSSRLKDRKVVQQPHEQNVKGA
jgi:acyl-CoA thioesterase